MYRVAIALCVLGLAVAGAQQANRSGMPGSAASQDRISREVRHELLMLPYYNVFDNLEYSVNGGVVTLMGQVTDPVVKTDAGAAVKRIEGVTSVVNQIQVLPLSPMDNQIRVAVYRAIYSQPGLDRYALQAIPPIHIIVDNGHVTLVGVVATQADKDLAGMRANTVSGVFSVKNDLRVEGK
ncbi:MAG TPA: BON domain-containing protein [Bryobacteraceae bacterium]|jgi:hyperosmotically inducible protein|nr:BON domain-containing protein [Bryobacteraceae bacterium]